MDSRIRSHLEMLIEQGTDTYGTRKTPLFMATLDPETGRYPEDDERRPGYKKRAYRLIAAPRGCNPYWDQPLLSALLLFAGETGETRFLRAAEDYLRFFMGNCKDRNGLFFWGNHYYYHAFRDEIVAFGEEPRPLEQGEEAELHEMRPLLPAWQAMLDIDPDAVEKEIVQAGRQHRFSSSGGFNRHADGQKGCAFLEAGGILVHALSFLYNESGEPELLETALAIARFSFEHRNENTDLLVNNPTQDRWDGHCTTTEVGLWAGLMLRAFELTAKEEFFQMGSQALKAYLAWGFDEEEQNYYGRLAPDGSPRFDSESTPYQPGLYSDIWQPLFPTHDYPLQMAQACLDYYQKTGEKVYQTGAIRWAEIIASELSSPSSQNRYAEHYGRIIVFLAELEEMTGKSRFRRLAGAAEKMAADDLLQGRMFVGHNGSRFVDAVDGIGFLLLGMLFLKTGKEECRSLF